MHRRLVCLVVALLVSGCSFAGLGPPPNYGYVVITAGGVGLRSGSSDVPPNLDLRLHATGAPLQASDVTATLDGNALTLASPGSGPARHGQALATLLRASPVGRRGGDEHPVHQVHGHPADRGDARGTHRPGQRAGGRRRLRRRTRSDCHRRRTSRRHDHVDRWDACPGDVAWEPTCLDLAAGDHRHRRRVLTWTRVSRSRWSAS